jgi:hypothetical protein
MSKIDYVDILKSEECAYCDNDKKRGYVFCYKCYWDLPTHLRSYLYLPLGDGFEEAVDDAVEYLML